MSSFPVISINGVVGAQLSPLDRGFAYGDGLFETCRLRAGSIPLWLWHLERLQSGCEQLMIPLDAGQLDAYLAQLIAAAGVTDGVIKIIVSRGAGDRGYRLPKSVTPTYCLMINPASERDVHQQGIAVRVCQQRLSSSPILAGIKHLNRLENVLARAEWQDDRFAEGLLLDAAGNVIEATASNIFLFRDGELFTPDLSSSGVAGVMRKIIIEQLAARLGLATRIAKITPADLHAAEEIFLSNSICGIWPVLEVVGDQITYYPYGSATRQLQKELESFLNGKFSAVELAS